MFQWFQQRRKKVPRVKERRKKSVPEKGKRTLKNFKLAATPEQAKDEEREISRGPSKGAREKGVGLGKLNLHVKLRNARAPEAKAKVGA